MVERREQNCVGERPSTQVERAVYLWKRHVGVADGLIYVGLFNVHDHVWSILAAAKDQKRECKSRSRGRSTAAMGRKTTTDLIGALLSLCQ